MDQRTKTPWKISATGGLIVPDNGNPTAVICRGFGKQEEDFQNWPANARRIVAAVNACGNIPTETLETIQIDALKKDRDEVIIDKMALMLERDILKAKNARLLAALKYILAFDLEADGATCEWVELVAAIRKARNVVDELEKIKEE